MNTGFVGRRLIPVGDVLYPPSTAQLLHLVPDGVGIVTSDHVGDDAEPVLNEFPFVGCSVGYLYLVTIQAYHRGL
jgi:hypothetical protein